MNTKFQEVEMNSIRELPKKFALVGENLIDG